MIPETVNALPVLSVSALPKSWSLPGFPAQSAFLCWSSAPPRWSSAQVWWSSASSVPVWWSSAPPRRSPALSAPHWWAPALSAPPWRLAVSLWSSSVPLWWSSAEVYVTNLVHALPVTHHQKSLAHHMDSCTTLTDARHLRLHFP